MTLAPTYNDAPTLVLGQPRDQPNTLAVCAPFRERGHLGLYCSAVLTITHFSQMNCFRIVPSKLSSRSYPN